MLLLAFLLKIFWKLQPTRISTANFDILCLCVFLKAGLTKKTYTEGGQENRIRGLISEKKNYIMNQ